METIKTTRTIEEVIGYKAFDGTEFKDKEECKKYENTARNVIIKNFKEIVIKVLEGYTMTNLTIDKRTCADVCPLCGCGEDWHYALICIKDENDLKIAQMYQELAFSNAKRRFTSDDIGKELVISVGESYGDHCYVWGTIDECVDNYRKALMMFKDDDVKSAF